MCRAGGTPSCESTAGNQASGDGGWLDPGAVAVEMLEMVKFGPFADGLDMEYERRRSQGPTTAWPG